MQPPQYMIKYGFVSALPDHQHVPTVCPLGDYFESALCPLRGLVADNDFGWLDAVQQSSVGADVTG